MHYFIAILVIGIGCSGPSVYPQQSQSKHWLTSTNPVNAVAQRGSEQYRQLRSYRAVYRFFSPQNTRLVTIRYRKPHSYHIEAAGCVIVVGEENLTMPNRNNPRAGCDVNTPYFQFHVGELMALVRELISQLYSVETSYAKRDGVKPSKLVHTSHLDIGPGVLKVGIGLSNNVNPLWTERLHKAQNPRFKESSMELTIRFDNEQIVVDKNTGMARKWISYDDNGQISQGIEIVSFTRGPTFHVSTFAVGPKHTVTPKEWPAVDRQQVLADLGDFIMGPTLRRGLSMWNKLNPQERTLGLTLITTYFKQNLKVEYPSLVRKAITKGPKCKELRTAIHSTSVKQAFARRLPHNDPKQLEAAIKNSFTKMLTNELTTRFGPNLVDALKANYSNQVKQAALDSGVSSKIANQWLAYHLPSILRVFQNWRNKHFRSIVSSALAECLEEDGLDLPGKVDR